MKNLVKFALITFVVFPAAAQKNPNPPAKPTVAAGTSQEVCSQLVGFIHKNLKNIAAQRMEGTNDNSAPRATNRLLNEVASLTAIQTTTNQLIALKCGVPEEAFDPGLYFAAALGCESARATRGIMSLGGAKPSAETVEKEKEACTQANWKPGF